MNGIINVLKPPNMTSQDVVSYLRGLLQIKKIGHGGTLDPGASGVLPIFLGKFTRLVEYSISGEKEYMGEVCFGMATNTQDSYGKTVEALECSVSEENFRSLLPLFQGEIEQEVPLYSAVRVNGEKLYRSAYRGTGEHIVRPVRKVQIHDISFLHQIEENRFLFRVCCSKGTYIRTLCYDMGKAMEVPAHLAFLLRSKVSGFLIEDSVTLDELKRGKEKGFLSRYLLSPDLLLGHLPKVVLSSVQKKKLQNGMPIPIEEEHVPSNTECCVYLDNRFAGVGRLEDGMVKILKMLLEDES